MKLERAQFFGRTFQLSVILSVSFFLVFMGMRAPVIPKSQKPKVHFRAVTETQIKVAQAGIEKLAQAFDICHRPDLPEPPKVHDSVFLIEKRSTGSVVSFSIPSRASPMPCV